MTLKRLLAPAARLKLSTLFWFASIWAMLLSLGIKRVKEYARFGSYKDYKYDVMLSGAGAGFSAWAITVMGLIFLAYTVVLIAVALRNKPPQEYKQDWLTLKSETKRIDWLTVGWIALWILILLGTYRNDADMMFGMLLFFWPFLLCLFLVPLLWIRSRKR